MNTEIKEIKHLFMTYRNGVVADTMRQAGYPHSIIFGLNVPQLAEIARMVEPSEALAMTLWQDINVRESRLLAAYLLPQDMPLAKALEICRSVITREEADMLAFRWIRHRPDAATLASELETSPTKEHDAYMALAIRRFL